MAMSRMTRIVQKRPSDCSEAELVAFEALVKKGGEVAVEGLTERIKRAERLVFLYLETALAGVGALKRPADSYRTGVFQKSHSPETAGDFIFEAGWIVVDEPFRDRKYSRVLLDAILKLAGGQPVYATTREGNEPMRRTNVRFGLQQSVSPMFFLKMRDFL